MRSLRPDEPAGGRRPSWLEPGGGQGRWHVRPGAAPFDEVAAWVALHPGEDVRVVPRDDRAAAREEANRWAIALFEHTRPRRIPMLDEELPYCNDRCIHCGVADIMRQAQAMPLDAIRRHVAAVARHGGGRIMFGVSELTIRPDFLDILDTCRRAGFHTVALVTNARRLAYAPFAAAAVRRGLTHALVSIYGPDARVHQSMTRTPGSFDQTVAGLRNLLAHADRVRVMTNTVVTRRNADVLLETLEFLADLGVRRACFSFVQIIGEAARHVARLVPRMQEVAPALRAVVARGAELGVAVGVGGVPYCVLPGLEGAFGVDDLAFIYNGEETDHITHRSPYERAAPCHDCALVAICPGVQEAYLERFGDEELHPIPGPRRIVRPLSALGHAMFPDLF